MIPFDNFSNDPEQTYFVDGIHHEVISELQRIGALTVTARQSVIRYEDTELSLTEIAHELGVGALMTGSVSREGDTVTIRVSLYAVTPEERMLWNETYDRSIENVLALYRDVAGAVALQVGATLTQQEEAHLAEMPEVNPDAYEAYLRGRHILREQVRFDVAIEYFNQAIELDPSFALPHAALAEAYGTQASWYMVPTGEAHSRAMSEALIALQLDSTLAEAHARLAAGMMMGEYDWAGAEQSFLRAIELNDDYAAAHQWYGQMLVYLGRTTEGFEQLRRAVELDPISPAPSMILGMCLWLDRRYKEATEQQNRVLRLYPTLAYSQTFLAATLSDQGMHAQAVAEFQMAIETSNRQPFILAGAAIAYGRVGQRDSAATILEELLERSELGEYVTPDIIAWAHIALGQNDEAIDWLERAYEEREQGLVYLKMAPWYDDLRSHPRFQALLLRMNFPE